MRGGLHVVFLAYRDWAMPIMKSVKLHPTVRRLHWCVNDGQYYDYVTEMVKRANDPPDLVMYCGWSNEPIKSLLELVPHVGLHCAESDRYSAGTPLQNQIIDGLQETKHRVFKVGYPELVHREWSHETTISLQGGISDVLEQLTTTGKLLYGQFLNDWPNIVWKKWARVDEENWRPKRKPEDSGLNHRDVAKMTTEELYDFFRCLEDPYPNGFIEDERGRLYVEKVRYEKK